jgi:[CysO sulfur-carrier protein]-thiocarboxylate-dependent cysteine synthase
MPGSSEQETSSLAMWPSDGRWDNASVRYDDILDAIGNTPLVGMPRMSPKPGVRIWAKLEGNNPTGSTKDRIAKKMIEVAEASGELTPDRTILEPTSGNTGISLAMVAARKGYKLTVVIPDNASQERVGLLRLFGAEIVFSEGDRGTNGSIEVARRLAQDPKYFMPFQYGNAANPLAHYEGTAPEILADLPTITHFVAGMGTGGTLTGNGRRLHEHDPKIQVIAAEPELGDLVYGLRSLEEGFVPPIFDPTEVNRKFLVNSADALRTNRDLTAREGIFAGISSGAVVHVAQRIAAELDSADIVCLLPDGGWKYLSTEAWAEDIETAEKGVAESLWW